MKGKGKGKEVEDEDKYATAPDFTQLANDCPSLAPLSVASLLWLAETSFNEALHSVKRGLGGAASLDFHHAPAIRFVSLSCSRCCYCCCSWC